MDPRRYAILSTLIAAGTLITGCANSGPWPNEKVAHPFAPTTLRIHPLTKLAHDSEGQAVLICHLAMLDAWGESVRGIGTLEVSVFGPGQPVPTQDAVWNFNLTDLTINTDLYDPATRTYRLQLGNLPEWTASLGSESGSFVNGSIVAQLSMVGIDDLPVIIQGRAPLRR